MKHRVMDGSGAGSCLRGAGGRARALTWLLGLGLLGLGLLGLAAGCGADTTTLSGWTRDDAAPEVARLTPRASDGARSSGEEAGEPSATAPAQQPAAKMPMTSPPASAAPTAPSGPRVPDPVPPAREDPPTEGVFGDWCARMGVVGDDGYDASIDAVNAYFAAVTEDCAVLGLTSSLTRIQKLDWGNYLVEYTYLFTGCPLEAEPVEGGLSVFGPANLESAGLASPALGPDDARRLSAHFVTALVTMLGLTESDGAAVERVLAQSAEQQILPSLSSVLWRCAGAPDAPDAGAADAGR